MILISHRGNINGIDIDNENKIMYIIDTINKGFDVEIDLWYNKDTKMFKLGHNSPEYNVTTDFLYDNKNYLWIHCKNFECLNVLYNTDLNYFSHDIDPHILTSKGFIWTYPGNIATTSNSVLVVRDCDEMPAHIISDNTYAICGDNYSNFKHLM